MTVYPLDENRVRADAAREAVAQAFDRLNDQGHAAAPATLLAAEAICLELRYLASVIEKASQ